MPEPLIDPPVVIDLVLFLPETVILPEDLAFARAYLDTPFERRYDRVSARAMPGLPGSGVTETLAQVRDELPATPKKRPMLIGIDQAQIESVTATVLIYEVHGQSEFAVARVGVAKELGLRYLSGIYAERVPAPLAACAPVQDTASERHSGGPVRQLSCQISSERTVRALAATS